MAYWESFPISERRSSPVEKGLPAGERALLPTFAEADSQPQGHKGQHPGQTGKAGGRGFASAFFG